MKKPKNEVEKIKELEKMVNEEDLTYETKKNMNIICNSLK